MFESPVSNTPECVQKSRSRFLADSTPVNSTPAIDLPSATKRRRQSFAKQSSIILERSHDYSSSSHDLTLALNRSEQELERSKRALQLEQNKTSLVEKALKASREAQVMSERAMLQLQNGLDDVRKSRTELKIERDALQKEISEIKSENEDKISKLQAKMTSQSDQFKLEKLKFDEENAELLTKLETLQRETQIEKEKYATLQDEFLELKKEKCQLELEVTSFEQKLAKIPDNIDELITAKEENTVLEAKLLSFEHEMEYTQKFADKMEEFDKMKRENQMMRNKLSKITENQAKYRLTLERLEESKEEVKRMRDVVTEFDVLKDENFKKTAEIQSLQSENIVLKTSNDTLQNQVSDLIQGEYRNERKSEDEMMEVERDADGKIQYIKLNHSDARFLTLQKSYLEASEKLETSELKISQLEAEQKCGNKRILLLQKERDSLQQLVRDIEGDFTMNKWFCF